MYYRPFEVIQVPCNTITKRQNEYLGTQINMLWKGSAETLTIYAVVTQQTWYSQFDEIGSTKRWMTITLPESPNSFTPIGFKSYLPLSGCEPKSGYGIKWNLDKYGEYGALNVLTVISSAASLQVSSIELT